MLCYFSVSLLSCHLVSWLYVSGLSDGVCDGAMGWLPSLVGQAVMARLEADPHCLSLYHHSICNEPTRHPHRSVRQPVAINQRLRATRLSINFCSQIGHFLSLCLYVGCWEDSWVLSSVQVLPHISQSHVMMFPRMCSNLKSHEISI